MTHAGSHQDMWWRSSHSDPLVSFDYTGNTEEGAKKVVISVPQPNPIPTLPLTVNMLDFGLTSWQTAIPLDPSNCGSWTDRQDAVPAQSSQ